MSSCGNSSRVGRLQVSKYQAMTSTSPRVTVAILAGGQSRRMGVDKARVHVEDNELGPVALIAHVALAVAPVASRILVVGGDPDLEEVIDSSTNLDLNTAWLPDLWPGEGPLGGIITALGADGEQPVVTVACDVVGLDSALLVDVLHELDRSGSDVCVPMVRGERQWHLAAWNPGALDHLSDAFTSGERSIRRGVVGLSQTVLVTTAAERLNDLDTPAHVDAFNRANKSTLGIQSSGADT